MSSKKDTKRTKKVVKNVVKKEPLPDLEILKLDDTDDKKDKIPWSRHPLMPQDAFRMLIVGPSGSGKTTLLSNLLLRKMVDYDRVWIISPTIDQPAYQGLKKLSEALPDIIHMSADFDELPTLNEDIKQNSPLKTLLVIDDFADRLAGMKLVGDPLYQMLLKCRHYNISPILLVQSLSGVPSNIRKNISHYALFNGVCSGVMGGANVANAICCPELSKKAFQICLSKLSESHSFLFFDNTRTDEYRYRVGLDKPIQLYTAN